MKLYFYILLLVCCRPGLAQFTFTAFNPPGSINTYPTAINNNGEVGGYFNDETGTTFGFIRHADGTFTTFQICASGSGCYVNGLNDLGEVVGLTFADAATTGFIRDSQGNTSTFTGPPGGILGGVAGLNNAGETIVESTNEAIPSYSLRSSAGVFTSLPSQTLGLYRTSPYFGLNNSGEAVGTTEMPSNMNATEGFVLNIAAAQLTYFDLTTVPPIAFPNTYSTGAYALNDNGSVAGCFFDGGDLTVMPGLPQVGAFQCVDYIRSPDGASVQSFVPPLGSSTYPDTSYFLNDSGIVGINQAGQIAGNFIDSAGSHGYIGAPSAATASPTISLVDVIPGPPAQAVFSVVDPVAGVYNVLTIQNNCTITIAPFTPGQTSPITVTATKTDAGLKAIVGIQAWNLFANLADFDPALVTVYGLGGPKTERLTDVPAAEHVLMISNGDPGLERLNVHVNGRTVSVALKASEKRIVNLTAWMKLKNNTLDFSGTGPASAVAAVVVKAGGAPDAFPRR